MKRLVDWGAGPRAGQFLAKAGQAFAAMDGRPSVAVDDIKKAADQATADIISGKIVVKQDLTEVTPEPTMAGTAEATPEATASS